MTTHQHLSQDCRISFLIKFPSVFKLDVPTIATLCKVKYLVTNWGFENHEFPRYIFFLVFQYSPRSSFSFSIVLFNSFVFCFLISSISDI